MLRGKARRSFVSTLTGALLVVSAAGFVPAAHAHSTDDPLTVIATQTVQHVLSARAAKAAEDGGQPAAPRALDSTPGTQGGYAPMTPGQKSGNLRVKVLDGRTLKPIADAEVVVLETEKRYRTGADGLTPWIKAPVLRSARFRFLVNELHGQLTLISYKNGYRDSIHMGVRMNEGATEKTTIWQYKIDSAADRRVEPVTYQEPYHRLWLIKLADRFRRPSQLGEGYEHP